MIKQSPLVSAIITTHNRADLLSRALRSAVSQSYAPLEIIVVDDASTDNTEQVVHDFQEKHQITYLKNDQSSGAAGARNRGIKAAGGEFVAGLDDDDEWHENRITELMAAYDDKFAFVTSDTVMKSPKSEAVWKKKKVIDLETLLYTNQVGNQVLVRRNRILETGGYDTELDAIEDYDLWVRLCAAYGPARNVQQPLQTIYMDHGKGRITDRDFKGFLQFYQKHKYRMNRSQRKYQLYNIRRTQGKPEKLREFIKWVPTHRYLKEGKRWVAERFFSI